MCIVNPPWSREFKLKIMSKGFADYLIAKAREFDRELWRDIDGVEVPLFSERYDEWLKTEGKISEASHVNYKRWLRKADEWICHSDRDFWTLLTKAWQTSDFDIVRKLCFEYEAELSEEKANAEKDSEYGESPKEMGNWISAFRNYVKFLDNELEKVSVDKKALAAMIKASRETAHKLFLSNQFINWGVKNGKGESTMESYVSNTKRINKELFCKTGYDLLSDFLPGYVKTKNMTKIDEMFDAMLKKLDERIDTYNETEMSIDALKNCRCALSDYYTFIKTVIK